MLKCLPRKREDLGLDAQPVYNHLGVVACVCNPGAVEVKANGLLLAASQPSRISGLHVQREVWSSS